MKKQQKNFHLTVAKESRQLKVAKILRKNPYCTVREIAGILKAGKSTISADIKEIKLKVAQVTVDDFRFHQNRVLRDIQDMKALCLRRLRKLSKDATKGTRWVEEFTKLIEKEAKILGLYAPEMRILAIADMSKGILGANDRDHAINSVMYGIESGVIDIEPSEIKRLTQSQPVETLQ